MKIKYLILISVSGFVIALDQLTKMIVHTTFHLQESVPVISGFFHFTYVRNYGAAFGFLSNLEPSLREAFFLSFPPIAMIIILMTLRTTPNDDRVQILALSSVFGGAIGNYIDRVRFRYVIDFLDFHWREYSYPAFNIADSAIVCGIAVLFFLMVKPKLKPVVKAKEDSHASTSV